MASPHESPPQGEPARAPLAAGILAGLIAVKLFAHVATNALGPYEFHRDEFLYMAMGEHLRLFGMDFPPFIAMLSETTRTLLGDSLFAIRLPPAIMSTLLLVAATVTARELGGGRFAQAAAAVCVLTNVLFLRSGNLYQPVVMDQLWWTLGLLSLLMLVKRENPRWWLAFGAACGMGLLTKFSMLLFGFAVFLAIVATPLRVQLRTRWPWLAAGLALLIGSPSFVGQIRLGWPLLDQMSSLRGAQLARIGPLEFLVNQPRMGLGFFVAILGLIALTFGPAWRRYRVVGWSCLFAFAIMMVLKGKPYYVGPVYPVLYGAGAVILERARVPRWGALVRWGTITLVIGYAALMLPLGLPILAPASMERYAIRLGIQGATETNVGDRERLPQDYADMLNWKEQVREVARVFNRLTPAERAKAVILASNYGEAGAIDHYGPRYALPKAIAFVGTYWFFGPGELPGDVIVMHGFARDDLADYCGSIEAAGSVTHPFAVREERDLTVYVCREPRGTLQDLWPSWEGEQ